MLRACLIGFLIGCIPVPVIWAADSYAATPKPKPTHGIGTAVMAKLAPPVACTTANRMDIFIDEDNIMWACECEMLRTGNICRWQVIGGVEAVSIRRHPKRHHITRGRSVWIYVKPTVVG